MGGVSGLCVLPSVMDASASDGCVAGSRGRGPAHGRTPPPSQSGAKPRRVLGGGARGRRGGRQHSGQSREVWREGILSWPGSYDPGAEPSRSRADLHLSGQRRKNTGPGLCPLPPCCSCSLFLF